MNLNETAVQNLINTAQRMVKRLSEVEGKDLQAAIEAVQYDDYADHAKAAARKLRSGEPLTKGDVEALDKFVNADAPDER